MRVFLGAVLALLVGWPHSSRATTDNLAAAASKTAGVWTATCDNLHDCVAIGSSDDGDGLFYVRIARDAAVAAEPKVKVVLAASDPIATAPDHFELVAKGGKLSKTESFRFAASKVDADGAALAADASDAAFLVAVENAETLDYVAGQLKGRLALAGIEDALRFIDGRQGRAGTPLALIARGMTPIGHISPPSPPTVQPAAFTATTLATPVLSQALLDMAKPACDPETVEAHGDVAAWALGPNRQLVAIPCTEGAYNVSAALFTTDARGEQPRPAMLEQPPKQGDAEADNVVVNYDFDGKTLTLSSLDKGRGLGDCGSMRTWVWTGDIFALLKASELENCPGALPDDWPPLFVAVRK